MIIAANVRPRNLKRGVTDKKLGELLGFKEAVGLSQTCGRLELSAESPKEFAFLHALHRSINPLKNESSKIIIEVNGETLVTYTRDAAPEV